MKRKNVIWHDRKRTKILGLPWTFTVYNLTEDRLYIDTGLFNSREDEVRLYRIMDFSLTRNLWQRLIRTGTIHVISADRTMKNFDIKNIRKSREVKEMLSEAVEKARRENRVYAREDMHTPSDGPGGPNPEMFDHDPLDPGMDGSGLYDNDMAGADDFDNPGENGI